jgi:hypothetical protein
MTNEADSEKRKALKEAGEKCAETVNRTILSVVAVALFCLLTTFGAADRSLLTPAPSIKVPFTEAQIPFVGFFIVAPLLLIGLTICLHIFYGYWLGLDAERRAQDLSSGVQYRGVGCPPFDRVQHLLACAADPRNHHLESRSTS